MIDMVPAILFKSYHRKLKGKQQSPLLGVRKLMESPAVEVGDQRSLRFCISTGCVDRERDVINVNGWELAAFKMNPVVLWAHDARSLPIGRVADIAVHDAKLMATVDFVPGDMPVAGEMAEAVFRLARDGYLKATSVGFRPLEWEFTRDKDRGADDWFPGIDFQRQELMELSIVTVPANPEALIETPPATAAHNDASSGDASDAVAARAVATASRARRRHALAMIEALAG